MAILKKAEAPETSRQFIGRAWVNEVQKEGPSKGVKFLNIQIDNALEEVTIKQSDRLQLWPNSKREGKKDADFRLSVVSAVPEIATQATLPTA